MPGKVLLLKNTFKNNFVMNLKPIFVIISFLSNRNMIEVAQFLKSEAGWKSVESGFNIKLIENNQMIGKLFNGDKFPLLLELNESEEVRNLLPKKFFYLITRLQSVSFILIFYGCIVGRKRYSY